MYGNDFPGSIHRWLRGGIVLALTMVPMLALASSADASWSSQTSGVTSALRGISCFSASTCWAVGDGGTIDATSNGGTNWASQNSSTGNNLDAVDCPSASNCWGVGEGGTIVATTDGGSVWSPQNVGSPTVGGTGVASSSQAVTLSSAPAATSEVVTEEVSECGAVSPPSGDTQNLALTALYSACGYYGQFSAAYVDGSAAQTQTWSIAAPEVTLAATITDPVGSVLSTPNALTSTFVSTTGTSMTSPTFTPVAGGVLIVVAAGYNNTSLSVSSSWTGLTWTTVGGGEYGSFQTAGMYLAPLPATTTAGTVTITNGSGSTGYPIDGYVEEVFPHEPTIPVPATGATGVASSTGSVTLSGTPTATSEVLTEEVSECGTVTVPTGYSPDLALGPLETACGSYGQFSTAYRNTNAATSLAWSIAAPEATLAVEVTANGASGVSTPRAMTSTFMSTGTSSTSPTFTPLPGGLLVVVAASYSDTSVGVSSSWSGLTWTSVGGAQYGSS